METIDILYRFELKNGVVREYGIKLDAATLVLIPHKAESPDWTKIASYPCSHCPLPKTVHVCPIAHNLSDLLEEFKEVPSIAKCLVTVTTAERKYQKDTDVQTGLGAIFGLIMATSGCPSMRFLKPMARFHLPFASAEETIFRSFGSFLIGQYLKDELSKTSINEQLTKLYSTVNEVNKNLLKRIETLTQAKDSADADQNAIVILDTFATILSIQLEDNISLISDFWGKES